MGVGRCGPVLDGSRAYAGSGQEMRYGPEYRGVLRVESATVCAVAGYRITRGVFFFARCGERACCCGCAVAVSPAIFSSQHAARDFGGWSDRVQKQKADDERQRSL